MDADVGGNEGDLVRHESFDRASFQDVRAAVREWAQAAGADRDRAESFTYAVNEGLINAIMHGNGGGELTLRRSAGRLIAIIEDRYPQQPFALPSAPPAPAELGGRGLWLASQLCDRVTVEPGTLGNRLILELGLPTSTAACTE